MKARNLFIEKDGSPDGDCPYVLIGSHDPKDGMGGAVAHVFGDDEAAAEKLAREILDQMSVVGGESGLLEVNEYQLMGGGPDDVGHLRIQRKRLPGDVTKWVLVGIGCALSDSGEWVERPFREDFIVPRPWNEHCLFDTPDAALRCWQTAVMRNVHDDGESKEDKPDDLAFLKEIQERLTAGVERGDPTQVAYAREMIRDWVEELEGQGEER